MQIARFKVGEPEVRRRLGKGVPVRLVRHAVKVIKWLRRRAKRRRRRWLRLHLSVHYRDALWSMDGTHLGRMEGAPVEGLVVRDVATTALRGVSVGGPVTAADVCLMLELTRRERGGLPLVLLSDNGSEFTARETQEYLRRHGVVHILSLPRTPQHNAWAERAVRELKDRTGLGKGVSIDSVEDVAMALGVARMALDRKPRPSRGGSSARALDATMPQWETRIDRERFYEEVRRAVIQAAQRHETARARRRAVREAIYATLDKYGLITQTRGGRRIRRVKSEIKS